MRRPAAPAPLRLALIAGLLWTAAPAAAAPRTCETRLDGAPLALAFDDEDEVWSSRREGWFADETTCPGRVVLDHLTPELSARERELFCAVWDDEAGEYTGFAPGRRDGYGRCRAPGLLCRGVNATAREVSAIAGLGSRVEAPDAERSAEPPGLLRALADQAGAVVVSGTAAYVAGALQGAGAALAATVGAPVALAGAAVSVVAVGGSVYLCGG